MTTKPHDGTWGMVLRDSGTLDTLIVCDACGREYRYDFAADELGSTYEDFCDWALDDAAQEHEAALFEQIQKGAQ